MMIKRLLRKHHYPPEGMDDAVQTVMTQCELWTDNTDMEESTNLFSQNPQNIARYDDIESQYSMVAEDHVSYEKKEDLRK